MITLRKAAERGHYDHGWLDSYHSFSFADYHDPKHMNFGVLRVINEDYIQAGKGFGLHPHRDMEIITYLVEGALEHKDSMGNSTVIYPGEVQRMSAGTGVRHSEFNHYADKATHLLQIWILPDRAGHEPSYGQKSFTPAFKADRLILVASKDGREGSVNLNQDSLIYAGKGLQKGVQLKHSFAEKRYGWLQLVKGSVNMNGTQLLAGDGAGIQNESEINITIEAETELLLFDLIG